MADRSNRAHNKCKVKFCRLEIYYERSVMTKATNFLTHFCKTIKYQLSMPCQQQELQQTLNKFNHSSHSQHSSHFCSPLQRWQQSAIALSHSSSPSSPYNTCSLQRQLHHYKLLPNCSPSCHLNRSNSSRHQPSLRRLSCLQRQHQPLLQWYHSSSSNCSS